ncbi:MAG: HAMP domain-containing histidine kinase [Gammaproteobacteria bacterium]|nr:HAMP domain-containing histidine kinase [Gammaproteobacteria bacterium]
MFLQPPATPNTTSDMTPTENLRRLLILRTITIAGELIVLVLATQVLKMALPIAPIVAIIAAHTGLNGVSWLRLRYRRQRPVSAALFFAQLVLDVLALSALLYFAGGSTNPFVSLLLLPLVIVATTLPRAYVWAMATLIVSSYSLLMVQYQPLPQMHTTHGGDDFNLHVLGMWFGFLLGVGMIIFFVVKMADSLREREQALADTREQALRDQHLVALGTLATGAAHELGTPLSTMAVLANELKHEHAANADVVEKAQMLRSQLHRCKNILSDITASAGQVRPEGGHRVAVDDYLHSVVALLRASRPDAQLCCQLHGTQPPPQILADKTLTQALMNILSNAADASVGCIDVEGRWSSKQLIIVISDRGEGLSAAVQAAAGTPFFTTKADGQGLGLYLARAVVERFGGEIQLINREGGGCQATIELPFSTIGIST